MGRWRPPTGPSTALITREGFERLKAEMDELWRLRRPEVVRALAAAAAEGDRSENAEYSYRKKQLGEIDRRVRYLSQRITQLKVVEARPGDPQAVFFGAEITVERDEDGVQSQYRIVGPDEIDASKGWISIDSPFARAALKKRVDDEFEVLLPAGLTRFTMVSVHYPE